MIENFLQIRGIRGVFVLISPGVTLTSDCTLHRGRTQVHEN
jgi:hypothetical protein